MPHVPTRKLRAIVNANVARFFPLSAAALVTDAAWIGGKSSVRCARAYAVRETLSLLILDTAKSVGCEVIDIRPTDEPQSYSLLPRAEIKRRYRAAVKRTAILTLVTVGVLFASLIAATVGQRLIRLTAERSQPPLEAVRIAKQLENDARAASRAESAFVSDRRRNQRLIELLLTVVRALNERDELTSLELADAQVREVGVLSPDAEHVLSALGQTLATKKLKALEGPTLLRRGDEVWSHLMLRPDEASR